jgi:hypothetical protein
METVSIRSLRGAHLRDSARTGKPLALTSHRILIGVVIPAAAAWVEHVIAYNWSRVRQSIAEGEWLAASGHVVSLEDVISQPDAAVWDGNTVSEDMTISLDGVAVGLMQENERITERLDELLSSSQSPASFEDAGISSIRAVRIGDLSAQNIVKAGEAGQVLAVTYDRELIGIVIPVTTALVEFLIEQNMTRVLYNIAMGEKQIMTPDQMTTLEPTVDPD